jgi:hypothetical protein
LLRHVSQEFPLQRFYWISVGHCENQGKAFSEFLVRFLTW